MTFEIEYDDGSRFAHRDVKGAAVVEDVVVLYREHVFGVARGGKLIGVGGAEIFDPNEDPNMQWFSYVKE